MYIYTCLQIGYVFKLQQIAFDSGAIEGNKFMHVCIHVSI